MTTDFLSPKEQKLFDFVKKQHGNQVRKYTGEPYTNHLLEVAYEFSKENGVTRRLLIPVSLCHDLFEDTSISTSDLQAAFKESGYGYGTYLVCLNKISLLTDRYTHTDYPNLKREKRKEMEAVRLHKSYDFVAQTVKCADIISNTKSIVEHDPKFAEIYLKEAENLLAALTEADKTIYYKALKTIEEAHDNIRKTKSIFHSL